MARPQAGTATPPAASREAAAPSGQSPGRGFALLAMVQFVLILAISVLNVLLPKVQAGLGLDEGRLAMLNAAYAVSFSGLLLLGGRVADLRGPRSTLVAGMAVFGLASVGAAAAPDAWSLVGARFGQGIGAAFAVPSAVSLVGALYPNEARRDRVMALWGGLAAFGGTAGMLLSGAVAAIGSWRWAFAVPVLASAVTLGLAPRLLPPDEQHPADRRGRLDAPGAVLVTAGISALSYGLLQAPQSGWGSAATLAPIGAAAVLLAGFAAVERRVAAPILPLSLLRVPSRNLALWTVFLGSTGITSVFFLVPLYLEQARGYSGPAAAAVFLPFGVGLVVTGLAAGALIGRFGPRPATTAGLLVAAAGLLLTAGIGAARPEPALLWLGLVVFAVGVGQVFAGATVSALSGAVAGQTGTVGAVMNTALETGPALGMSLVVTLALARAARLGAGGVGAGPALGQGGGYALRWVGGAFAATALAGLIASWRRRTGDTTRAARHDGDENNA